MALGEVGLCWATVHEVINCYPSCHGASGLVPLGCGNARGHCSEQCTVTVQALNLELLRCNQAFSRARRRAATGSRPTVVITMV